jgi:hypothetical protein
MVTKREPEIPVTPSSANLFADLGFAEPEEELTKAQLASHIRQVIKRRRFTPGFRGSAHGCRSTQGLGPAQRSPRKLLQRAPDALLDRTRPGH